MTSRKGKTVNTAKIAVIDRGLGGKRNGWVAWKDF